jgi:hypothetical protein
MLIEDIAKVESRNLELLHQHFEKVWMPDEEYFSLVEVLISAGASIAAELGNSPKDVEKFEATLRTKAKNNWLASTAKNALSNEERAQALEQALLDYERILKQIRKSKRKPL